MYHQHHKGGTHTQRERERERERPTYQPCLASSSHLVHHRPDLLKDALHLRHEHPHVVHQGPRPRRVAHGRDGRGGDVLRLWQVLGLGAERGYPRGVPAKPLVPAGRPPVVVNLESRACFLFFGERGCVTRCARREIERTNICTDVAPIRRERRVGVRGISCDGIVV